MDVHSRRRRLASGPTIALVTEARWAITYSKGEMPLPIGKILNWAVVADVGITQVAFPKTAVAFEVLTVT